MSARLTGVAVQEAAAAAIHRTAGKPRVGVTRPYSKSNKSEVNSAKSTLASDRKVDLRSTVAFRILIASPEPAVRLGRATADSRIRLEPASVDRGRQPRWSAAHAKVRARWLLPERSATLRASTTSCDLRESANRISGQTFSGLTPLPHLAHGVRIPTPCATTPPAASARERCSASNSKGTVMKVRWSKLLIRALLCSCAVSGASAALAQTVKIGWLS